MRAEAAVTLLLAYPPALGLLRPAGQAPGDGKNGRTESWAHVARDGNEPKKPAPESTLLLPNLPEDQVRPVDPAAYADLLREANTDFQRGRMSPERLENYSAHVESYWRQLMRQASPTIVGLLLEASDEQLEEFFDEFERRNDKWLAEFREKSDRELHEEYQRLMTKELERWFGPLSPTQQQAVMEWRERVVPLAEEGFKMRQRWQARLSELLSQRADVSTFQAGITELLVNPEVVRPPVYQARLEYNHRTTIELVHEVGTELTEVQRKHLAHRTSSIARDLDQLACEEQANGAEFVSYGQT